MKKQIVAFNGSPAGRNSATYRMVDAFLAGAARAGADTRQVLLSQHTVRQCQGCFACWFQMPGRCVQADGMEPLLRLYQSADMVCFASPVYSWNMTALLKNFVDRRIPLKSPLLTQRDTSFDLQDAAPRQQQYVAISNCGFPGENNFSVIQAAFSCCQPVLEIYRNCGKLLTSQQPAVQETVSAYLSVVEQAGYELLAAGEVCPETRTRLSMPLMDTASYVQFLGM